MKKSLVALAALAATSAFAQFSITGLLDAGYQAIDYKGGKAAGITNNGSATSTIQFNGATDLGGGLKAEFKINSDINPTTTQGNTGWGGGASTSDTAGVVTKNSVAGTAGSWLNSEQRVGLAGGFGRIDMGVINNGSLAAAGTGTPFGTAVGSGFRSIYTTDSLSSASASPVRHDNSVRFTTPSFNGITGEYYYVKKNVNAKTPATTTFSGTSQTTFSTTFGAYDTTGISELTVKYNQGPLNIAYAAQTQDATGTGATIASKGKLNTLGVNYTVGALTGYLMNQTAKDDNTGADGKLDRTTNFVGVKYVMGAHSFMAQNGSAKLTSSNQAAAAAQVEGAKSTVTGLGYDYALGKTTSIYVRTESINDKAGMVAPRTTIDVTAAGKITRQAIGLRHTF